MSTTIDEKVVEMKFDNSNFESGVSTSLSSLEKLKSSLNFSGAASSFESLGSAAGSVGSNVDSVNVKFSALQVVAVTALQKITNAAMDAGEQLLSALTIDSVLAGFSEYETQIGAIQTIMANTASDGTTLEEVNEALDELNEYADLTIYNFTEMTKNIGTFTAAGLDLDTSVSAIQGIANLAAVSGSTSQQASTAMYQLSQALAAGTVKLQDWNSVVNAGMGGETFQNALKETARTYGIAVDEIIESAGSFRESLSEGWITSDILAETLSKFTVSGANEYLVEHTEYTLEDIEAMRELAVASSDTSTAYEEMAETLAVGSDLTSDQIYELLNMSTTAEDAATKVKTLTQLFDTLGEAMQSGWTQSWEIILGDFEEAKALFTDLSDFFSAMIDESADTRNAMLEAALADPWEQLTAAIEDTGTSLDDLEAYIAGFAAKSGFSLDALIDEYGDLSDVVQAGEISADILIDALKDLSVVQEDLDDSTVSYVKYSAVSLNETLLDLANEYDTTAQAIFELNKEMLQNPSEIYAGQILKLSDATDDYIQLTDDQVESLQSLSLELEESDATLNELIADMEKPGGRQLLIESLMTTLTFFKDILSSISEAWSDAFSIDADDLYNVIDAIHSFTEKLVINEETADKLTRTLKGFFAVLDIIVNIITSSFRVAFNLVSKLLGNINIDILTYTANIGDVIVAFRDWIEETDGIVICLNYLIGKLGEVIEYGKEWIKTFLESPAVIEAFNKIDDALGGALSNIVAWLSDTCVEFKEFIDYIKTIDFSIENLEEIFNAFVEFLTKIFYVPENGPLKQIINTVKDVTSECITLFANLKDALLTGKWPDIGEIISGVFNSISESVSGFINQIKNVLSSIKDFISKYTNFANIFVVLGGIAIIAVSTFAKNLITNIFNPLEAVEELVEAFAKNLKAAAFKKNAEAIKEVAEAVLILVAALVVVSFVDTTKLWSSLAAISILAVVCVGLIGLMTAIQKLGSLKNTATTIISIASMSMAMLMLATTLVELSGIGLSNEVWDAVVLLGVIISAFAVCIIAMTAANKIAGTHSAKITVNLISFALAMKIVVSALSDLVNMQLGNIGSELGAMVVLMGTLALVMRACTNVKSGAGLTAIAAALSLKVLMNVLASLDSFDAQKIVDNIEAYLIIFSSLALLMLTTRLAGKNASGAGVAAILISVALGLLATVMSQIAQLDTAGIIKGTAAIVALMAAIALVLACCKLGENESFSIKSGATMVMIASAVGVLAVIVAALSLLDPAGIARGTIIVGSLLGLFAVLVAALKQTEKAKLSAIVVMSVMIGVLVAAIGVLSMLDPSGVTAAGIALGVVILMSSVLVYVTKFASMSKSGLAGIATMTLVVGALALVIGLLAQIENIQNAITVSASLSILLLSFGAALALVNVTSKLVNTSYGTMLAMLLVVGAIALLLGVLDALNVEPSINTALSISVLLLAISAALVIMSKLGVNVVSATSAAASLAIFIIVLATVIQSLGMLIDGDGINTFSAGIEALEALGTGLGNAVGNIIAGLGSGVMKSLQNIADGVVSFVDTINGVDIKDADKVEQLVGIVAILADAVSAASVSSFLSVNSLELLASQLKAFGEGIGDFASSTEGVNLDSVNSAAEAGKRIADMASALPVEGGLWQAITGSVNMSSFASELKEFGSALVEFGNTTAGMSASDVSGAAEAGKLVAEMASSIPNEGGLWGILAGNNSMEDFAAGLIPFAEGIKAFADETEGMSSSSVSGATEAGVLIADMASSIPNEGGLWGILAGNNSMEDFAAELEPFAKGIKAFADETAGLAAADVSGATDAGLLIAEMASEIPTEGGILGMILGNDKGKISDFAEQIVPFGEAIADFATSTNGVTEDGVKDAVNAIELITTSFSDFKYTKNDKLTKFADQLDAVGTAVIAFTNSAQKIAVTDILGTITDLSALADSLNGLDYKKNDALTKLGNQLTTLGTDFYNYWYNVQGIDVSKMFSDLADGIGSFSNLSVDTDTVNSAVEAGKSIASMAKEMPTSGGLWDLLAGSNDLSAIGSQLGAFGESIAEFSIAVSQVGSFDNVTAATEAGVAIAEMAADIPETGGLAQAVFGETDLADFGKQITGFITQFVDVDLSGVDNAISASEKVLEFVENDLSSVDGFNDAYDFGSIIESLAESLSSLNDVDINENVFVIFETLGSDSITAFLDGFSNSTESVSTAFTAFIDSLSIIFAGKTEDFRTYGITIISNVGDGIASSSEPITVAVISILTTILTTIETYQESFSLAGQNLGTALAAGIQTNSESISNSLITITDSAIAQLDSQQTPKFETVGTNFIQGLTNGLNNSSNNVISTIVSIGESLVENLKSSVGVASPSTIAEWVGEMIDLGLANGIKSNSSDINSAMANLGGNGIAALQDAVGVHSMSTITRWIGNEIDEGLETGVFENSDGILDVIEQLGIDITDEFGEITDNISYLISNLGISFDDLSDYSVSDFMEYYTSALEDATDATEDATDATDSLTDSTDSYSDSSSSASSSTSDTAEVFDYTTQVIEDFNTRFGETLTTLSDTDPMELSSNAVNMLSESVYEAAVAAGDSSTTILEAFAEMFEGLEDSIEGSMDLFSAFDYSTEVSVNTLLENMRSQVEGVQSWADNIQELATRGVSQGLLQYLADMGTSGYQYVNAFLEMTASELAEAEYYYAASLTLPESAATQIVSSFAYAGLMASEEFTEAIESTDMASMEDDVEDLAGAYVDASSDIAEAIEDVNEVTEDAIGTTNESIETTETFIETTEDAVEALEEQLEINEDSLELSEELVGTTIEQTSAQTDLTDATTEATEATEALNEATAENVEVTQEAIEATSDYKSMRSTLIDTVSSAIDIFSEFSAETELTSDELLSNMQSQIDGVSTWADNLQTLAEKGISQGLLQELAELGPSGDGYEYVNAFVNMSAEQLAKANELYSTSLTISETVAEQVASSYAEIGLMASTGFADGIDTTAGSAEAAEMGENAADSLKTALDEHSPSRVTMEAGTNFAQGFIDGLAEVDIAVAVDEFGNTIITAFIESLTAADEDFDCTALVISWVTSIGDTVTLNQELLMITGQNMILFIEQGVDLETPLLQERFTLLIAAILAQMAIQYLQFSITGQMFMTYLLDGITGYEAAIKLAFTTILASCVTLIRNYYSNFYNSGAYIGQGLADGLSSKLSAVQSAASALASAAAEAIALAAQIASPSKVTYRLGEYFGEGFVNALYDSAGDAENAGSEMAYGAEEGLISSFGKIRDLIDGSIDTSPTIRPVLDLTDVEAGAQEINAMLSQIQASTISASMNARAAEIQNGNSEQAKTGNTYQFTQNNYSPKSLTRAEIYRQTKNQFSAMKGVARA